MTAKRPRWVMLIVLSAVAALSQAYRTLATIMAPGLQFELGLTADQLGVFAGAFHLSFGLAQIPFGVALDLYGVRRTVGLALAIAVAGTLICSVATGLWMLVAGQLLIGIGCAPAFIAALFYLSKAYSPDSFAKLSGVVLSLSGFGMLATSTPLAWLVEATSWRGGFVVLAVSAVAIGLAVVTFSDRGTPAERSQRPSSARSMVPAILGILAERRFWGLLTLGLVGYASFIALRGLWAVPALTGRYDFSLTSGGNVLLAASLAAVAGPPVIGLLGTKDVHRRFWLIACAAVTAIGFAALALSPAWQFDVGLIVLIAFLTGFTVLQFAEVRAAYPSEASGSAFGVLNTASFLGVALMQWVTGVIAAVAVSGAADAYRIVFLSIALMLGAGLSVYIVLPRLPTSADVKESNKQIRHA